MATSAENNETFQPGQLGTRHLLGVMAVVCVVAALSASRLRSLPWERSAEVAVHWLLVAAVAAGLHYRTALARRRNRTSSGELLLRVMRRPVTERKRKLIAGFLTAAVVFDAVAISLLAPTVSVWDLAMRGSLYALCWLFIGQGLLWAACLDHWLTNVYWAEFREHGLLTHGRYYPWANVTRIGWSPEKPGKLVILHSGNYDAMTIDPAMHEAVTKVLERIRGRLG